jgi:hypothetical protein
MSPGRCLSQFLTACYAILWRRADAGLQILVTGVASLVTAPAGRAGRPSQALTLSQAADVLDAARDTPTLRAYVRLSLLSGLPTEELRSLP